MSWLVCFLGYVAGAGGVFRGEVERGEVASVLVVVQAGDTDARVFPVVGFSLVLVHMRDSHEL